jgi:DNA polymerase III delta subunit
MVKAIYLLVGQDVNSKDIKINRIKQQFLSAAAQDFNQDILYARDTKLKELQEKLLFLPLRSEKRIVVIKNAEELKEDAKVFLIEYVKNPYPKTILILDIASFDPKDRFISQLARYAEVSRFQETHFLNTFDLSRQIDYGKTAVSLKILNRLLQNGEKPERIMGGLRVTWERYARDPALFKKRIKYLLLCDIEIKTGRLKSNLALEKLIVNLCAFKNFTA